MPAGQTIPTTPYYGAKITTVDPTQNLVEILLKGDAQPRRASIYTTPIAFRWPVVGESWMVHQYNGTWYLDSPWPDSSSTTPFTSVNSGDAIINTPTGVIHIIGSNTSTPEDYTLNPPTAWSAVSYATSWGDAGAPWRIGQYSRDPLGYVRLRGVSTKSTAWAIGNTVLTLPAGYRPSVAELFSCAAKDATAGVVIAQLEIAPTGILSIVATVPVVGTPAAMSQLSLSGITFTTS